MQRLCYATQAQQQWLSPYLHFPTALAILSFLASFPISWEVIINLTVGGRFQVEVVAPAGSDTIFHIQFIYGPICLSSCQTESTMRNHNEDQSTCLSSWQTQERP